MANHREQTPHRRGYIDPSAPWPLRALMAVYRFLASVKLAVLSIASLAGVLAYGTWFEREHGTPAAQEYVYQSVGFSILLAFLATNVLCAATIRYPWKKRQIGFLVTHTGLLTLIFGSWWGFHHSEEGMAGTTEGHVIDKLTRTDSPVIRVRQLDRKTGHPDGEYEIPFKGGAYDWPAGKYQLVSKPPDPFKVAVKAYYPASSPGRRVYIPAEGGMPALKLRPMRKAPGEAEMSDVLPTSEQQWFALPPRTMSYRITKKVGPAKFAFLYVNRPELVDDFLNPPENPGLLGSVRLRYKDNAGKSRTLELRLDDAKPGAPIPLPDSDITATFVEAKQSETQDETFASSLGDTQFSVVQFTVRKGAGKEIPHLGIANMPMAPTIVGSGKNLSTDDRLLAITYYRPPMLGGGGMAGNFGVVEVMGDPQGKLYYRIFGRDEKPVPPDQAKLPRPGVLRGKPGPLAIDKQELAFGGNPNMPMTLAFRAEDYLVAAEPKLVYSAIDLKIGEKSNGLAAALVEMTVDGETKELWIQRPPGLDPRFTPLSFKDRDYEIAFDFDRPDLGFSLKLEDFEVGFDPGVQQASSFVSEVTLNDEKQGIKGKPITISMNQPLTHRQYTFYQSSYQPVIDPETNQKTGEYQSVFQVGYDAGRPLKYAGSFLVVLGSLLQFYIVKSGIFSEGATDDRHKSADRARKILARKAGGPVKPAKPPKKKKSKFYTDDAIL